MTTVSTKPYLIRAIYEWCVDQGFTPYIAALVDGNTRVPPGFARNGQIVLNVSAEATQHLVMDNEGIAFSARFNGMPHSLFIPVGNVVAIYARENGHGMAFEVEGAETSAEELEMPVSGARPMSEEGRKEKGKEKNKEGGKEPPPGSAPPSGTPPRGGHLKIVK